MTVVSEGERNGIWLHRFAVLTAVATFFLIIAGGLVTSTDSGLAVPDWPLSYGQLMPPMVGGIFYEHGHRVVATTVGFLTTILAFWLWRKEDRRWVRTLGWCALIAVIAQGVLGGITVLFLLPTPISVAHATLAQSFFCLTIVIALATSPTTRSVRQRLTETEGPTRNLAKAATLVVFVQLILGAIMRHTQSGLAIPDFPLSYGGWLPPFSSSVVPAVNNLRLADNLGPVDLYQIWIHFAHRLGALIVAGTIVISARHVLTTYKTDSHLREPALAMLLLLMFQILLGALTVWTGKNIEVATAHVATGALLLASTVVLTFRVYTASGATGRIQQITYLHEARPV